VGVCSFWLCASLLSFWFSSVRAACLLDCNAISVSSVELLVGCCRAGNEDEWEAEADRAEEHKEPSEAVWAAFWGWDCCGPAGVLDRLYGALKIPERSWSVHAPAIPGPTQNDRPKKRSLVACDGCLAGG
jgi:hypothetical protein